MKRILLILILLFPLLTLVIWVYYGMQRHGRALPPGVIQTNFVPSNGTNATLTNSAHP